MKTTLQLLALMFVFAFGVNEQNGDIHIQFAALKQDGTFYEDLKQSDLKASGLSLKALELRRNQALELVVLVDSSLSQERTIELAKAGAEYFIDSALKTGDRVSISRFANRHHPIQSLTPDFDQAKKMLSTIRVEPLPKYIPGKVPGPQTKSIPDWEAGSTSIWDAIIEASRSLSPVPPANTRQIILLVSDGFNTSGGTKLDDAIGYAVAHGFSIFALGIGDKFIEGVNKAGLRQLSERTAGLVALADETGDLKKAVDFIIPALRATYSVTLSAEPYMTAGRKEIKFEIANTELRKKVRLISPKAVWVP
jgi:hypothetical protein